MKIRIRIYKNWRKISKNYSSIMFFRVYWQFDEYVRCIEMEILNFIIEINLKVKDEL